jgi:peptidoglycan/xylan/chitin deacetylase (PgdA/CDA1 family)
VTKVQPARGGVRRALRRTVETAVTGSGVPFLARHFGSSRVAVLAYHNVVPDAEADRGDASLHLPLSSFEEQIHWLAHTHDVVDLATALTLPSGTRPRAVITFDDAYRGAVTLALPMLRTLGLPAVVFVAPGLLGMESTWWDEMAEAGLLTPANRTAALVDLAGRADAVRGRFLSKVSAPTLPASYGIATLGELQAQLGEGITVGSHAWDHEHLPTLPDGELEAVLRRSVGWVEGLGPDSVPWLALPYGAGDDRVYRCAIASGHDGVLLIRGGLWSRSATGTTVPRVNVPAGVSRAGLELRASGLFPAAVS